MITIGVDLAGPKGHDRTALVAAKDGEVFEVSTGWKDTDILSFIDSRDEGRTVVVGIDAPLSYTVRGGHRDADSDLQAKMIEVGLRSGSLMAPLAPRMVYLTLRGIALSRGIEALEKPCRIVEVHPGAFMALNGAPVEDVVALKSSKESRWTLLQWLSTRGISGLPREAADSDHLIAATAAMLAARDWAEGDAAWVWPAEPPQSPYDFSS